MKRELMMAKFYRYQAEAPAAAEAKQVQIFIRENADAERVLHRGAAGSQSILHAGVVEDESSDRGKSLP